MWDLCWLLEDLVDHQLAGMNDPKQASGRIYPCLSDAKKTESLSKLNMAAIRARKALDAQQAGNNDTAFYYRPPSSPTQLAALLQSPPSPQRHRRPPTDQPPDQPAWASHLEGPGIAGGQGRDRTADLPLFSSAVISSRWVLGVEQLAFVASQRRPNALAPARTETQTETQDVEQLLLSVRWLPHRRWTTVAVCLLPVIRDWQHPLEPQLLRRPVPHELVIQEKESLDGLGFP